VQDRLQSAWAHVVPSVADLGAAALAVLVPLGRRRCFLSPLSQSSGLAVVFQVRYPA